VEARLVARGYELLRAYAPSVGISVEETGALLVAWDDEQAANLPKLADKAAANGYMAAEVIDAAAVRSLEPHLGEGVSGGMLVPGEHLIDPWSTPIAFATEAVVNGCELLANLHVTKCEVGREVTRLVAADGREVLARFVVNAAGLHGDTLHRAFGFDGFAIRPRRGELIVFDKLARPLLGRTILPVPTSHTKGVLVAPTVFGNIMLGPTADDIDDRAATGSTRAGLDTLLQKGHRILPALLGEEVTAVYAGLRAATEHSDYQLTSDTAARYVCLGGIRSTGLTASMALGEEAVAMLAALGLGASPKDGHTSVRLTPLGETDDRPYLYGGTIICHCERVTSAEIDAAVTSAVPACDLDGLRRRTRALAGRCQGFYCAADVCAHAAVASDRPISEWMGLP
jgi:glycerol-3-phosphate dehydrogenase